MKIKSYFLLFAIIIVSITACKKEYITPLNSIVIGDNNDIMAYSGDVNIFLEPYGQYRNFYSLDMDNNGFDDLKFVVEEFSGTSTLSKRINIIPLSESVFVSYENFDEEYCQYTNTTGDTVWNAPYDSTQTYDSIIYINNNHEIHQKTYALKNTIYMDDPSYNNEMTIASRYFQENQSQNYDYKYDEWIGKKDKYLGIKIINNKHTYLGWIKIEVYDYNKIHIGEYYLKQIR